MAIHPNLNLYVSVLFGSLGTILKQGGDEDDDNDQVDGGEGRK